MTPTEQGTYRCDMRDGRTVRDSSVQSVHRAISILQVLALRGAAGVTEIATELGVHKSTVFRLLSTLEARGLVNQHSERGGTSSATGSCSWPKARPGWTTSRC